MTGLVRRAVDVDGQRLAALLIAAGPALLVIAGVVTPSGLYQEPDDAVRLGIIDDQRSRFAAAQALWALWLLIPGLGFVLLSRHLATLPAWLPTLAALGVVAGSIAGVVFVVLQTADPQRYWLEGDGAWASALGAWLILTAAAFYGLALLRTDGWAVAGVVLAVYAVLGTGAMLASAQAFVVTAGFSVASLAPAFVAWRTGSGRVPKGAVRGGNRRGSRRQHARQLSDGGGVPCLVGARALARVLRDGPGAPQAH
jgi:hypothetical protein